MENSIYLKELSLLNFKSYKAPEKICECSFT